MATNPDQGGGGPALKRAKMQMVEQYMNQKRESKAWDLWAIRDVDVDRFKLCYPDDDSVQILVNIARSGDGLGGVERVLKNQKLEMFLPVAHEIVDVAQRPGFTMESILDDIVFTERPYVKWEGNVPFSVSGNGERRNGLLLPTLGTPRVLDLEMPVANIHAELVDASGMGKSKVLFTMAEAGLLTVPLVLCQADGQLTPYWHKVTTYVEDLLIRGGSSSDSMGIGDEEWDRRVREAENALTVGILLPIWVAVRVIRKFLEENADEDRDEEDEVEEDEVEEDEVEEDEVEEDEDAEDEKDEDEVEEGGMGLTARVRRYRRRLRRLQRLVERGVSLPMRLYGMFIATSVVSGCREWFERLVTKSTEVIEHFLKDIATLRKKLYVGFDEASAAHHQFRNYLPRQSWQELEVNRRRALTKVFGPGLTYHIRKILLLRCGQDTNLGFVFVGCASVVGADPSVALDCPQFDSQPDGVYEGVLPTGLPSIDPPLASPTNARTIRWEKAVALLSVGDRKVLEYVFKCTVPTRACALLSRPRFFVDHYLLEDGDWRRGIERAFGYMSQAFFKNPEVAQALALSYVLDCSLVMKEKVVELGILSAEEADQVQRTEFLDACLVSYLHAVSGMKWLEDNAHLFTHDKLKGVLAEILFSVVLRAVGGESVTLGEVLNRLGQTARCHTAIEGLTVKVRRVKKASGLPEEQVRREPVGLVPSDHHGTDLFAGMWAPTAFCGYFRVQIKQKFQGDAATALASLRCPHMSNDQRKCVREGTSPAAFSKNDTGAVLRGDLEKFEDTAGHPQYTVDCLFTPQGATTEVISCLNDYNKAHPDHPVHVLHLPTGFCAETLHRALTESSHPLGGKLEELTNVLSFAPSRLGRSRKGGKRIK